MLVAVTAVAILTGCSSTAITSDIPWPQPTWHREISPNARSAADDLCPKGSGPRGLDCRSKAPGYEACMQRHPAKNSAMLCQQALVVRIECRFGERAIFHDEHDCASSFESYISCRTGIPKRSDDVCAAGEREFLRCPEDLDRTGDFDCAKARDAYYDCRGDARSDDIYCSTYIEVVGVRHALRVSCSGLLDKYLTCTAGGLSPNECAFGSYMRLNCLRDLRSGVFLQISTCDSIWSDHLKDCSGTKGLGFDGPTSCTHAANWNEASYSICERRHDSADTVGVAYVNPKDGSNHRLPLCWASKGENHHMDAEAEHAIGDRVLRVIHRLGETRYESM
ncbi:hypothetical protein AAH991_04455 [Microbispora sp. ZYX-F-249]|uniref:Uncharacterized protein n=1 Tax=Microbispora maris TaxID=3144104 RepID=A0ABV0AKH3_9ACTN